jgi:hypothetical protein
MICKLDPADLQLNTVIEHVEKVSLQRVKSLL